MGKIDQQALIERIHILQRGVPEVEAAAVISLDGLIMASALPDGMSEDRISAMSAAMLSLGEQINREMGLGTLEQLYTRGSNGYVVLLAVGKDAVFTTLVQPEAKLGVLFLELRKTAEDLARLLDGTG
ncbi:MAG TPA: roadblock/LC7 domain-containing protein [Anaerolineaceae bacterium]|nr:roadblock/LC7 domain-containing protein [Anaerolineaceae bacterium]